MLWSGGGGGGGISGRANVERAAVASIHESRWAGTKRQLRRRREGFDYGVLCSRRPSVTLVIMAFEKKKMLDYWHPSIFSYNPF